MFNFVKDRRADIFATKANGNQKLPLLRSACQSFNNLIGKVGDDHCLSKAGLKVEDVDAAKSFVSKVLADIAEAGSAQTKGAHKSMQNDVSKAQQLLKKIPSPSEDEAGFMDALSKKCTSAKLMVEWRSKVEKHISAWEESGRSEEHKETIGACKEVVKQIGTTIAVWAVLANLRNPKVNDRVHGAQLRKHLTEAMAAFGDGMECPDYIKAEVNNIMDGKTKGPAELAASSGGADGDAVVVGKKRKSKSADESPAEAKKKKKETKAKKT
jgi:hypothetical protein